MEKDNYYEARMDKIFGKDSPWEHRTLRTVFDPFSSEWNRTSVETKIEILKKVGNSGEDLGHLLMNYKARYNEQNRKDISSSAENALSILLQKCLTK